jgi:hypothetical protein
MSLKNDLMYPFGNPFRERMTRQETVTALNNVLKLAKDKIRVSHGEMEEILLSGQGGGAADDVLAERSVQMVEDLLQYINGQKEEEHTN